MSANRTLGIYNSSKIFSDKHHIWPKCHEFGGCKSFRYFTIYYSADEMRSYGHWLEFTTGLSEELQ